MDEKVKHLELIQGIINRMASNSFMLKGWAVSLVVGFLVLATKDSDKLFFLVAYIPVLFFWGLDAYYLRQERLYRSLYDKARNMEIDKVDFTLNVSCDEIRCKKARYANCFFSVTELWFYFPLAIAVFCVIVVVTYL